MHSIKELNILCVGEIQAGKSSFLCHYTGSKEEDSIYKIFLKKHNDLAVFLHELESEVEVYLKYPYDGILFFMDLVNFHKTSQNILKWLELCSEHNGINIFKIPLRVIVMKTNQFTPQQLNQQISKVSSELQLIIEASQIIYHDRVEDDGKIEKELLIFYDQIRNEEALGIKCNNVVLWSLYGVQELALQYSDHVKMFLMKGQQKMNYYYKVFKRLKYAFK